MSYGLANLTAMNPDQEEAPETTEEAPVAPIARLSLPVSSTPTDRTSHRIIDIHAGWGSTAACPEWRGLDFIQKSMYDRGIGMAFISSMLARRFDLIQGNETVADGLRARLNVEGTASLRGWLVMHPAQESEVQTQMKRFLAQPRFIGAAIYADPMTGLPVTVSDAHHLTTAFRRYGKPILVETPTAAAMAEAIRISEDMQGIKVIASGMGGDEWREAVSLAARTANVFLDISGALIPEKIEYAIEVMHGTRKLMFASGAPSTDPAAFISLLDDLPLSQEDKSRILYVNAERMFGLGPAVQEAPQLSGLGDEPAYANYLIGNVENPEQAN